MITESWSNTQIEDTLADSGGPGRPGPPRPPDLDAQLYSLEAPVYNLRENNEF